MENTVFTDFLSVLNIKYTNGYSNKLYNEHPYRGTLYSISHLLSTYNIPNAGARVVVNELEALSSPFIAYVPNDFIIIEKISEEENQVIYIWKGRKYTVSISDLRRIYQGIVLLAEPNEQSIETDYKEHKKNLFFRILQKSILLVISVLFPAIGIVKNGVWGVFNYLMLLLFSGIGIFICYLLLNKQVYKNNDYADKICSLFHQKDCNDVLQSKASRIGIFSWSEIGLGYFISNFITIAFCPYLIPYLSIINICVMPYTCWSVWYQYRIVKQWCVLCLIVQILLILTFIINLVFGNIYLPVFSFVDLILVLVLYMTPILLINLLVTMTNKSYNLEIITQQLNRIKKRDDVFLLLLKQQPYYAVDKSVSKIIFGNPSARIGITILTNPHCEPCGKMHKRVSNLLETMSRKLYVQYIYSAFDDSMLDSNRFLIAAYLLSNNIDLTAKIYDDWFSKEKYSPNIFIEKFDYKLREETVELEMKRHNDWKIKNQLASTPAVLINGYHMPDEFKIEDLIYFTDIENF